MKLARARDDRSVFFRQTRPFDLDGDGLNDVIVNVPKLWPNFIEEGGVLFVFRGRSDWPSEMSFDDVDVTFSGTSRFAQLGERLAIDDFDVDQRDDLVVVDAIRGKVVVLYGQER